MSLKARYINQTLKFKIPAGTSRGVLTEKECWFIIVQNENDPKNIGVGECGMFRGLSIDDRPDYESMLQKTCSRINEHNGNIQSEDMDQFPSIQFGVEQALIDLSSGGNRVLFPSLFTEGRDSIDINGLIWMGDIENMRSQIRSKIDSGFHCIKMKIGSLHFEEEINILSGIRKEYNANELEIRVDANGAFKIEEAPNHLQRLAELEIHSIEQPIKAGQPDEMAKLCRTSPVPIALDEELIGIPHDHRSKLLHRIKPDYIILKPSLIGGFRHCEDWIRLADEINCGWWITSALESNIGLSAIAQWAYTLKSSLPQGLGTGSLYTNNFPSPIRIENGKLFYDPNIPWELESIFSAPSNQFV
ncbi:MAG: o-succinylbenzoate synthase [Chitinophagales bacterium]|nr:o-succinylbenzoate synthase [Chitinophagales bacterium]